MKNFIFLRPNINFIHEVLDAGVTHVPGVELQNADIADGGGGMTIKSRGELAITDAQIRHVCGFVWPRLVMVAR
jgi:hypothetical protein